jgi:hypothetical protein
MKTTDEMTAFEACVFLQTYDRATLLNKVNLNFLVDQGNCQ